MSKTTDLALTHDGVKILVPWSEMRVSDSVFIPTWDTEELHVQLKVVVPFRYRTQPRTEDGYRGVRVWRTK